MSALVVSHDLRMVSNSHDTESGKTDHTWEFEIEASQDAARVVVVQTGHRAMAHVHYEPRRGLFRLWDGADLAQHNRRRKAEHENAIKRGERILVILLAVSVSAVVSCSVSALIRWLG